MFTPRKRTTEEFEGVSYRLCPAKTFVSAEGETRLGHRVPDHCEIVGRVSRALIDRFPQPLRGLFPEETPLVAAAHDLGKVSPYFFEKLCRACTIRPQMLPEFLQLDVKLESHWGGHAGVSELAAKAMGAPEFVPEILGQHHGFSPQVRTHHATDEPFGRAVWQEQRELMLQDLKERLDIPQWPTITSAAQARLLAGLTTVSDWIGSGEFFEDPDRPWQENINRSLDSAGFITPSLRQGLGFETIFSFSPWKAQSTFFDSVTGHGAYVLEAPMGLGKTEAALYAAYRLLLTGQARGIYFALPTQLTSNRIHQRFNHFLDKILVGPEPQRGLLLHGAANLLETDLGEEGLPGRGWFNQAKRGLLAPFAVGTVDQALMAAMNVKHGFVRAFGLAGKVVILDEVHTYDAYTGTILDALVELLTSLQCTVLILSATLNQSRREQILNLQLASNSSYPLVTAVRADGTQAEIPIQPPGSCQVGIHLEQDERRVVEEVLNRAVEGQQVLWVENTVREAQQTFLDLASRGAELGVECGLIHSRFTKADRQDLEDRWLEFYGKGGWEVRRCRGHILVGTQVLEQSLDIDADFLVGRIAPTDLMLQRMGRLWRHEGTPRPPQAKREAWWIAPGYQEAVEDPERSFSGTAHVYSPYVLCRSLEVWQERQQVFLPDEVRMLIEKTYEEREEQGLMNRWKHELEHGTNRHIGVGAMRQLANITLSESGITRSDTHAPTRYSETDYIEVLLVRNIRLEPDQRQSRLRLRNREEVILPWQRHRLSKARWRQLSVRLMRQTLSILPHDDPGPVSLEVLKNHGLHHCFYLGDPFHDEATLRVLVVDEAGDLFGMDGGTIATHGYRSDLGYYRKPSS